ncbi:DNA polymerase III subunit epsilon [Planococcus antarcticus DSM 14505]|uniref:DNA polymerase III subunit epsilon n=1 Tax=Planococcus antarcticus DSM 14505 TaxID=1185653 RepID=A0A1C7DGF6_9BACL|nr:3'-5' exonuclease [Planococcus antarcticus]ANU10303.1 DNA polymerase III subunit epsilon [Planococcus antarcticus DSM 14505]EIM05050.1 DNA polymerase III subunit epsilon [Planococcus antarcticus DSM 14505]
MEKRDARQILEQKMKETRPQWNRKQPARPKKYKSSMQKVENYVVLDFETTGLRAGSDKIIQIGAVRYLNHQRKETMYMMVNPQCSISGTITRITGITNNDVENAPVIEEVAHELIAFIGGLPIVAHNAPFDMGFLYALEEITPIPEYTVIDTVKLARRAITQTPNHKLTTLTAFLKLEHDAHDALGDCLATAAIYQYCYDRI